MNHRLILQASIVFGVLSVLPSPAAGSTVFGNIDGTAGYGWLVGPDMAVAFTPLTSSTLSTASAVISASVTPVAEFDAAILSDTNGLPGSVLGIVRNIAAPQEAGVVTIDFSSANISLSKGLQYWFALGVGANPPSPIAWYVNSSPPNVPTAVGIEGFVGPWGGGKSFDRGNLQFEIDSVTASPEPAALLLCMLGFGGVLLLAKNDFVR